MESAAREGGSPAPLTLHPREVDRRADLGESRGQQKRRPWSRHSDEGLLIWWDAATRASSGAWRAQLNITTGAKLGRYLSANRRTTQARERFFGVLLSVGAGTPFAVVGAHGDPNFDAVEVTAFGRHQSHSVNARRQRDVDRLLYWPRSLMAR